MLDYFYILIKIFIKNFKRTKDEKDSIKLSNKRNKKKFLFILSAVILAPIVISNFKYNKKYDDVLISRVIDGDTYETSSGLKIRLGGANTCESVHPSKPVHRWGIKASNIMKKILTFKEVQINTYETGRYRRDIADVYLDDTSIAESLIENGLACASRKYSHPKYFNRYLKLEKKAKNNRAGFWSEYYYLPDGQCPCDY